jgi:hypothetical protein
MEEMTEGLVIGPLRLPEGVSQICTLVCEEEKMQERGRNDDVWLGA